MTSDSLEQIHLSKLNVIQAFIPSPCKIHWRQNGTDFLKKTALAKGGQKETKKEIKKKLYHLHGGKRPPLACSAMVFLGEQLACLVLYAAAGRTDVPLGQRSSPRHTTAHASLTPCAWDGLGEGFPAESPQCMASAVRHRPEKETRLKENRRDLPTRVQEHQRRRRLLQV